MLPADPEDTSLERAAAAKQLGFTIVESVVVMALLLLGVVAMTSTLASVHALQESNRERRAAAAMLESIIQDVRLAAEAARDPAGTWATDFTDEFAPGGLTGAEFDVRGLEPQAGQASVGTIAIIVDETTTDAELGLDLGLPRDLDNDGVVVSTDVSNRARMLPVVARLRWRGASGNQQMRRGFYVLSY